MKFSTGILAATCAFAALNTINAESFVPETTVLPEQLPYELENVSIAPMSYEDALLNEDGSIDFESMSELTEGLTASYNEGGAAKAVRYSAASYCSRAAKGKISSWNCGACRQAGSLTKVETFYNAKRNTNGYVGYDPSTNRVIVAFAGTDPRSWKNIWTDISTAKTAYRGCGGCQVHYGFYTAYAEIRPTIVALIKKKLANGNTTVHVTGHSLGGALAAHCIADLQSSVFGFASGDAEEEEPILLGSDNPAYQASLEEIEAAFEADVELPPLTHEEATDNFQAELSSASQLLGATSVSAQKFRMSYPMYTFGQPRLGNPAFANWFMRTVGGNLFRVTHNRDPVPHLPPLAMGFQHPTTEVFYNKPQTSYSVCPSGETKSCSNQFVFQIGFDDHKSYVRYPVSDDIGNC